MGEGLRGRVREGLRRRLGERVRGIKGKSERD